MAAAQALLGAPCQGLSLVRQRSPQASVVSGASCSPFSIHSSTTRPSSSQLRAFAQHAARASRNPSNVRRAGVVAKASEKEENVPSWAKPGSEEVPPWAKQDKAGFQKEGPTELPFGLYLLFSVFTAIAAVGSIYEYTNKNPIFGLIQSDSGLYAPILGFFVITGFPTALFLLYKAITSANKLAEQMDEEDGVNKNF